MSEINAENRTQKISISSSAVLAELFLSVWTGRRKDREASEEVVRNKNAQNGVASVNKILLGDCHELSEIQSLAAEVRRWHYEMTLPWSNSGLRLLPTEKYFEYSEGVSNYAREFDRLVGYFLSVYEQRVQEARVKLGSLFNQEEYPDVVAVAEKFSFQANYLPVPESGDFRVDVGAASNAALKESYEQYYQDALTQAMKDLWRRLHETLTKMSDRLSESGEKSKVFRDTLVSNVMEVAELLRTCNIANDPAMEEARQQLMRALTGVTPEGLRKDSALRRKTKQDVDDILNKFRMEA